MLKTCASFIFVRHEDVAVARSDDVTAWQRGIALRDPDLPVHLLGAEGAMNASIIPGAAIPA